MKEISNIEWLHGSLEILKERPLVPFDDEVIGELDTLSKALMKDLMTLICDTRIIQCRAAIC